MPEEAEPSSLSDRELMNRGTPDAVETSEDLKDRVIIDVNGEHVGHVSKCYVEGGKVESCDVTLARSFQTAMGAESRVARLPIHWVEGVREDGIHISHTGQELVGASGPPHEEDRGAPGFPRKVR